ncbi:sensor histidine kinase [Thalassomonas haliotis]|uniref:histidine kinase n=1 Tax=Thalassomonas haliotis TaxID=485448 RepID=A0ABY7VFM2_9GAMM|nr:sensor histidine kinase [Thalassomonas haliotis]WDE12513.1 CHASE3 domain-containing protein [Thalassomonas haliotis]
MIGDLLDNKKFLWSVIVAIIAGVIIINVVLAIKTIDELAQTQKGLTNTGEVILDLDKLHILVLSAETGQRGYLLTQNEAYLAPYKGAISQVLAQIKRLERRQSDLPSQGQKISQLLVIIGQKMYELSSIVELALDDKEKRALKTVMSGRGKDLYTEIKVLFDEIKTGEIRHRNHLYQRLEFIEREAKFTFGISAVTSFLLLIGILVMVRLNDRSEQSYRDSLEAKNLHLAEQVQIRTKELTLYSEELARSNRELEDFAFVASHDLQEPLRKIRAFGDRLASNYGESIDEKGQDFIQRMRNAAERMSNLISDLLEYSRINTRGKAFTRIALNQVINDVVDDLEVAIEESAAMIDVADLPEINGDNSQLNQLFLNLLSNAIKFRQHQTRPQIRLRHRYGKGQNPMLHSKSLWHVITVTDNGIGFEQEFEEKIFIPFQRLHARSAYKGTGIGLAVCRRIVERHGGVISVKSEVGKGTEFTLAFPDDYQAPNTD